MRLVFDEFHFAEFVDNYVTGSYLFDIHPPLGKLTLLAVAKAAGYKHINYTFDQLGKPYGDLIFYPQRAFSAFLGSFIPPVMFLTARELDLSLPASLFTGAMPLFDMLLCIESRLILTDAQLILYIQLCLLCALKLWNTRKNTVRRYIWLLLTAVFGGCAISTKWTAIAAPGLIAIISITGLVFPAEGMLDLVEMVVAGAVAISIYVFSFWMHFRLLPNTGPGNAFMRMEFQKTLIGGEYYNPNAIRPGFIENFRYLNWEMLRANSAIETRHPWESKWYEWLYNARGVLYIDEQLDGGKKEQIYLLMNPLVAVLAILGVFMSFLILLSIPLRISRAKKKEITDLQTVDYVNKLKKQAGMIIFFLSGWVLNLLPYIGVKRCTFLYHVLPSLQMSTILAAISLDHVPNRLKLKWSICILFIIGLCGAFVFWAPWIYGLHRTNEELDKLRWMPRWN